MTTLIYLRMMWLIGRITGQTNEIEVHARALEASHRQRDSLEEDLRHLAFHDELTGLANRALLHDRVEHALAASSRTGRSVALFFGDLDGFKTVNDTIGHDIGDTVLQRASRLLASIVRPGDTVARLGGDEFAVLMVDVEREDAAVDFAQRIVTVLRNAPDFEGQQVGLSISVGVAFAEPGKSTEQLLSEADSAMYEAKEKGKNRVEVFQSSMRSRMLERLELTNGFRWALGRSEFFLQYQPIVSLSDNRLHGFEALVRWSHPTLGTRPPAALHPHRRGDRLHRASRSVGAGRGLRTAGPMVSSLGRKADAFGQSVAPPAHLPAPGRRGPHRARPQRARPPPAHPRDHRERPHGRPRARRPRPLSSCERSASASLSTTSGRDTPPSAICSDSRSTSSRSTSRSSTRWRTHRPDSSALVTAIIGLARSLGLDVIAEGIEHESQLHRLVELGCDKGQGFLMARPLDRDEARSLVAEYAGATVT